MENFWGKGISMTKQEFIKIKIEHISHLLESVKEYKERKPAFYKSKERNMLAQLDFFVTMTSIESVLNESLDQWKHMLDVVNSEEE